MTAFAPKSIEVATEGAFAEAVNTFTKRIPVIDVRHGSANDKADDKSVQVRQNELRPGYLGPQEGTFEIDVYLPGAGVDTSSGALVETWFHDLLSDFLGGSELTEVGGTVVTAGTTATAL